MAEDGNSGGSHTTPLHETYRVLFGFWTFKVELFLQRAHVSLKPLGVTYQLGRLSCAQALLYALVSQPVERTQ